MKTKWISSEDGTLNYEILIPDDEDDDFDEEDDDMEFGCAACGNPAYPKCKNSCPMYDD